MRGTIQKGLAEPLQAVLDPGENLLAATWADRRAGSGDGVAALIGGSAAVSLKRKGESAQGPTYTGQPGLAGHVPIGYLAVGVTDRRLLFLWAPSPKVVPVPTYAFAPHDLVQIRHRNGVMGTTLEVTFSDRTMVILDLLRTHKAASVAKAATDLVQRSRSIG